jgi:4-hydroxy-2-oxoheptanedioate aldolase
VHGKSLKDLLASDKPLLGTMIQIPCPQMVEIVGMAGFDYIIFDMEHTGLAVGSVEELICVADASGLAAIVRPACTDPHLLGCLLDGGVRALIIPRITSAAEAKDAVAACRFPPGGVRGVCPHTRAGDYGLMPVEAYIGSAEEVSVGVLIETKSAATDLLPIITTPGIDFAMLGPTDLAFELGVLQDSERVAQVQRELDEAGSQEHVEVIRHIDTNIPQEQLLQMTAEEGRKMYWCSTDAVVCAEAYAGISKRIREATAQTSPRTFRNGISAK